MNRPIEHITRLLGQWYATHQRDLPWRKTKDAYAIWLSEIILQQTRVEQGTPYYYRFLEKYPRVQDFAAASQDEILKLWQGLGYYSRARNMQLAAQTIVQEYGGIIPADYDKIRQLKGVGDYTAAAIASFAYDMPRAVVDGNVMRVFARLYAIDEPIDTARGKKLMSELADQHLDELQPANHNQAIMDFGALVCTPRLPQCPSCPLAASCAVCQSPDALRFPVKKGKIKTTARYFNYLVIRGGENMQQLLLQRREGKDIWQGLYEFPLIETLEIVDEQQLIVQLSTCELLAKKDYSLVRISPWGKQVLSHQHIYYRFVYVELPMLSNIKEQAIIVDLHDIANFAVPKPIEKEIAHILTKNW